MDDVTIIPTPTTEIDPVLLVAIERRLEKLVAMQTTHDNPEQLQASIDYVSEELARCGMKLEHFGESFPMVLATTRGTRTPRVLILIHLDVVPETARATCLMRVEGERIYGRGVYDMKFAAACGLELVTRLAKEGTLHDYDFGLMLTTDEEVGGFEVEKVLRDEGIAPGLTIIPDGGEGWTIESAAKGLLHGTIIARGRAAHGSRPWEGDNAFDSLLEVAHELKKFHGEGKKGTTVSINYIRAGKAINQIPDQAILRFDARSFAYEDIAAIDKACRVFEARLPVTYQQDVLGYPFLLNEHHDLTQDFISSMSEFLGRPASFSYSYAATDARWFAQFNLPAIVLRPRGGDIHGPEEWVQREDVPRFLLLLERYVKKVC